MWVWPWALFFNTTWSNFLSSYLSPPTLTHTHIQTTSSSRVQHECCMNSKETSGELKGQPQGCEIAFERERCFVQTPNLQEEEWGDESNGRRDGVYTTFELIEIKFERKLVKQVADLHMSGLLSANWRWREGGKAGKGIVVKASENSSWEMVRQSMVAVLFICFSFFSVSLLSLAWFCSFSLFFPR